MVSSFVKIGLLFVALIPPLTAAAPPRELTAQEKAKLKAEAEAYGAAIARDRAVFDPATGGLKKDASGQPLRTQTAPGLDPESLGAVKDMLGVQGIRSAGEPGQGGNAGAAVSAKYNGSFSCGKGRPAVFVGGLGIRIIDCSRSAEGQVASVTASFCTEVLKGGACDRATYWSPPQVIAVPGGVQAPNGAIRFSCESSSRCVVNIQADASLVTTSDALTEQANQAVARDGRNSAYEAVRKPLTSEEFARQLADQSDALSSCMTENNRNLGSTGKVSTCDGTKSITFLGAKTGDGAARCDPKADCVRESVRSLNYQKTCLRQNATTGYVCDYDIPTKECRASRQPRTLQCVERSEQTPHGPAVSGCESVKNGPLFACQLVGQDCTTAGDTTTCRKTYSCYDPEDESTVTTSCSASELEGTKRVDRGADSQCLRTEGGGCVEWMDYYVYPDKAALASECAASPLPLADAPQTSCVRQGTGQYESCKEGGWYRRTLPDAACTAVSRTSSGEEIIVDLTNEEKPGCGYCVRPVTSDVCYAKPTAQEPADSCSGISPTACTLASTACRNSVGSICLSQEETYQCVTEERSCVEYKQGSTCVDSDIAQGFDKQPRQTYDSQNIGNALSAIAVLNEAGHTGKAGVVPRIFGGEDMRCRKPLGYSRWYSNDCCKEDLRRPGGGRPANKCSIDEVKLASYRRASKTVYIGDYCSRKVGVGRWKKCVEQTQTYCAFQNILSKLVQVQGRQQLAEMVASSPFASKESRQIDFPYYSADKGRWGDAVLVNGVTVRPWVWPAYCAKPETAETGVQAAGQECAQRLEAWFATCDRSDGNCGPLPEEPYLGGDSLWVLQQVDTLRNVTTALSPLAAATGACEPGTARCRYTVSAWPPGVGGKAIMSKQLVFPLSVVLAASEKDIGNDIAASLGDNMFLPKPLRAQSPLTALPATVSIAFSANAGASWATLSVPTAINDPGWTVPGTDIQLVGGCSLESNRCQYQAIGTVSVSAKPWGFPESPDCTGLTPAQISALDFSKIDLSEWLATVVGKVRTPDGQQLATAAKGHAEAFLQAFNEGRISVAAPRGAQTVTIQPREEFGPFTATLRVAGNFPVWWAEPEKNDDLVESVQVDWGDCSVPELASRQTTIDAQGNRIYGFQISHAYPSPDKVPPACGGGERNIEHEVKVTIVSRSGMHYTTLKVRNVWDDFEGSVGVAEGGGPVTVPVEVSIPQHVQH